MTLDTYAPKSAAERKAYRDAHYVTLGASNSLAIAHTLAETIKALRDAGVSTPDRHPPVIGMVGQLAFLTGQSLGPPSEALAIVDHFGTMHPEAS